MRADPPPAQLLGTQGVSRGTQGVRRGTQGYAGVCSGPQGYGSGTEGLPVGRGGAEEDRVGEREARNLRPHGRPPIRRYACAATRGYLMAMRAGGAVRCTATERRQARTLRASCVCGTTQRTPKARALRAARSSGTAAASLRGGAEG